MDINTCTFLSITLYCGTELGLCYYAFLLLTEASGLRRLPISEGTFLSPDTGTMTLNRRSPSTSSTAAIHGSTETAEDEIVVYVDRSTSTY